MLFARILKLERWAVLSAFNYETCSQPKKHTNRNLFTEMLVNLWRLNQLAWIWLDHISTVSGWCWNLQMNEMLLEISQNFKSMKFFEKVHEVTQNLLDDINEV